MKTKYYAGMTTLLVVLLVVSCSPASDKITYTVTVSESLGSKVSVSPSSGVAGTKVTLNNTPDTDYVLSHYIVDDVEISGNTFTLHNNVTVKAVFIYSYPFSTPAKYREMASINGETVTGSGTSGVFVNGRKVAVKPFKMAKHQTTYELWEEVRNWAGNSYSYDNAGREGYPNRKYETNKGTDNNTEWTADQKKSRPVTEVNWRSAVVWCNAYSEMNRRTPVYYTDATYSTILRTASDTVVIKADADGYRLPTEVEWEYAARGGNPSAAEWKYQYAGTNSALGLYGWYDANASKVGNGNKNYGANPVGTKTANSAGLYDMSGNVWEWCWDKYGNISSTTPTTGVTSGSKRVLRGGGYPYEAKWCTVTYRREQNPGDGSAYTYFGFRVAASP